MIAQFLTEMDHSMASGNIYIIGATNRPDLLDPSILQPGRFDVTIYLGISNDKPTRVSILQAKTRKMKLDASLDDIEAILPQNFTGADIYAFTSRAYTIALANVRNSLEQKYGVNSHGHKLSIREFRKLIDSLPSEEKEVKVSLQDFQTVLQSVKRSVSDKDLQMYQQIFKR